MISKPLSTYAPTSTGSQWPIAPRRSVGEIDEWGVFQVTSMGAKFYDAKSFNQDLSKRNVGKVMHVNDDMFSTTM